MADSRDSRWFHDDLEGLTFFDADGNEMSFDDFEKASFGGNRSTAGQDAARIRRGSRAATMLHLLMLLKYLMVCAYVT